MEYLNAKSIEEALNCLQFNCGDARIITGGTDLLLDKASGKIKAETLVDITNIEELNFIQVKDGFLEIGGITVLSDIYTNSTVQKYFPSICKGIGTIGSRQIRNIATLAGNIVSAQPAADGAMAIAPLEPIIEITSSEGTREIAMLDSYEGFGVSRIDPTKEILTKIKLPLLKENEKASFIRLELRKSLSLPMLNVGAKSQISDGIVKKVVVNMAPVGIGTKRATQLEEWFTGKSFTIENIEKASKMALLDAKPRSNPLRGSKEYREQTLPVLVKRAFYDIAEQLNLSIEV